MQNIKYEENLRLTLKRGNHTRPANTIVHEIYIDSEEEEFVDVETFDYDPTKIKPIIKEEPSFDSSSEDTDMYHRPSRIDSDNSKLRPTPRAATKSRSPSQSSSSQSSPSKRSSRRIADKSRSPYKSKPLLKSSSPSFTENISDLRAASQLKNLSENIEDLQGAAQLSSLSENYKRELRNTNTSTSHIQSKVSQESNHIDVGLSENHKKVYHNHSSSMKNNQDNMLSQEELEIAKNLPRQRKIKRKKLTENTKEQISTKKSVKTPRNYNKKSAAYITKKVGEAQTNIENENRENHRVSERKRSRDTSSDSEEYHPKKKRVERKPSPSNTRKKKKPSQSSKSTIILDDTSNMAFDMKEFREKESKKVKKSSRIEQDISEERISNIQERLNELKILKLKYQLFELEQLKSHRPGVRGLPKQIQ